MKHGPALLQLGFSACTAADVGPEIQRDHAIELRSRRFLVWAELLTQVVQ